MNHKVLQMLEDAGFEFTPDVMSKLPLFEKLLELEREACADIAAWILKMPENDISVAIRARGQG